MTYQGVGLYEQAGEVFNVMGLGTTPDGELHVIYAAFGNKDPRKYMLQPLESFNQEPWVKVGA